MNPTGSSATSSSFSAELLSPAAIVVAEATWVSLLLSALLNASRGTHVAVSFLALALPALAAVALTVLSARLRRWRRRGPVLAVVVIIGAALSAGVVAELSRSGSFSVVATHPWDARGHGAGVIARSSWLVAALAWLRGVWLGILPPSLGHVGRSVGLGAIAFLAIIAARTFGHPGPFIRSTRATGWLIFLWFPLAVAALALVHERDLERELLHRSGSPPNAVWFSVLTVPLVAVALIALLLAVVIGPAAPLVGKGVTKAGDGIWWLVRKIGDLIPHGSSKPATPPHTTTAPAPTQLHPVGPTVHHVGHVSPIISVAIVVVLVAIVIYVVIRYVRPPMRLRRRRSVEDLTEDEERDSVFSWRHLADQLRGVLARLFRRRERPGPNWRVTAEPSGSGRDQLSGESIRRAYRRMLVAARKSGQPRAASETTGEFEARLGEGAAAEAGGALGRLTSLYEEVRYGEVEFDESTRADAAAQADAVSAAVAAAGAAEAAVAVGAAEAAAAAGAAKAADTSRR